MADNVAVTAGAGTSIATDDVAGVHYQIVKLAFGALDTATLVQSASGLPVSGTFWQATQPVSGTVTANLAAGTNNIGDVDVLTLPALPAGTNNIGDVDVLTVNGVAPAFGSGVRGATVQRVTIATDDVVPVSQSGAWSLSANQSVNVAQINGVAPLMGNGVTGTGSQRVTIASDNTAFAVNATLQTGANVIGALSANQSVNNAQIGGVAVSVGSGVTGTGVQRVNLATDVALPAGTNALGKVQVDNEPAATFRGRVSTFRTPGRAGTAGQKIFALHNATGSTKIVRINHIAVDMACTVVKAITTLPPLIRVHRFTAVPTNGTSLTKVAKDSALSSNASITAWGDASADGTSSASALTVTIPAGSLLTQEFAPRFITAAGYEMFDRAELLVDQVVVLRALEGIVVNLDYAAAGQNPTTDMWTVTCDWWEV